jgi:hypothetical protein
MSVIESTPCARPPHKRDEGYTFCELYGARNDCECQGKNYPIIQSARAFLNMNKDHKQFAVACAYIAGLLDEIDRLRSNRPPL